MCKKYNLSSKPPSAAKLDHLIVDDKHKLIYCYVPKAACTNWKRIMLILSGSLPDYNGTNPLDIPAGESHARKKLRTLNTFSKPEIERRLQEYMSFIFVRHPYERLLSAYRNKFQNAYGDYFRSRYGRKIIERYRKNASKEALASGHDVSFKEFVHYLVDRNTLMNEGYNEHWDLMFQLCHPCRVKYSFIGKYETLNADADYLLRKIGLDHLANFPKLPVNNKKQTTADMLDRYMKGVSEADKQMLMWNYRYDFEMFQYSWPKKTGKN